MIQAATFPHPGAFTICGDEKIIIWKAEICLDPIRGVPGRILVVGVGGDFVVQCGCGLIRVAKWHCEGWSPRFGDKFGFYKDLEFLNLRDRYKKLEEKYAQLEERISSAETKISSNYGFGLDTSLSDEKPLC